MIGIGRKPMAYRGLRVFQNETRDSGQVVASVAVDRYGQILRAGGGFRAADNTLLNRAMRPAAVGNNRVDERFRPAI